MQNDQEEITLKTVGLLKTSRPGHHKGELTLKAFPGERKLCIVTLVREYINRTALLRKVNDAGEHRLFVSFDAPHKPVGPSTIGRWTKLTLARAGLDTSRFSAHSTRSAAVSAAKAVIPVELIIRKVGWASAAMFAKFYNKPIEEVRNVGDALLERFEATSTRGTDVGTVTRE